MAWEAQAAEAAKVGRRAEESSGGARAEEGSSGSRESQETTRKKAQSVVAHGMQGRALSGYLLRRRMALHLCYCLAQTAKRGGSSGCAW